MTECRCVEFAREALFQFGHVVEGCDELSEGLCSYWVICAADCDTRLRVAVTCGRYDDSAALWLAYRAGQAFDRHKDPFFEGNRHPWKSKVIA